MKNLSELKVLVASGGHFSLDAPQQKWRGENEIMQTSTFAGQEMMAIQKSDDEPHIYELCYLNFKATGFNGIEDAKKQAPDFAWAVLEKMTGLITRS